mgnify:CR=1 FL=1
MRVNNKIAVVTGAASGQGASEAKLLASEGATVIVADIRKELGSVSYTHLTLPTSDLV